MSDQVQRVETVWVTGASGFLGRYMVAALQARPRRWEIIPITRDILDITATQEVRRFFTRRPPTVIVHCAALADTARCEAHPRQSHAVNVEATRTLAELAQDARLAFLSTDLVFDGNRGDYTEEDAPNPLNLYGCHKLEAERAVLAHRRHLVVRTSLNAGASPSGNRSFNEQMKNVWKQGRTVTLFRDEFRNPIAAELTARAVRRLVEDGRSGLFHVAGRERWSRLEMGAICRARYGADAGKIVSGTLREFAGPRRAPDTTLNCRKVQRLLPFPLLGLKEWLDSNPEAPF